MKKTARLAAWLLFASLAASPAAATTATRLSEDALADQADLIVIGRALEQKSVWVGRNLVTLVTLSVSEALKGAAGSTVTVALPGGIDSRRKFPIAMTFPAAPTISPKEDVFLFLNAGDEVEGAWAVAGFSQGKYSIVDDLTGQKSVSRDLTGLQLVGPGGTVRGTQTLTPLADFKAQVRKRLAETGK